MPVSPENNKIKNEVNGEVKTIRIKDITDSEEEFVGKTKKGKEYKIKYPYYIIYENLEKQDVQRRSKTGSYARDWSSKFYVNKQGYLNWGYDQDLLAICTIFAKTQNIDIAKAEDFGANTLIGFEFDASVKTFEGKTFINWIETFKLHGIEVPFHLVDEWKASNDIVGQPSISNSKQTTKSDKVNDEDIIDPDDLPF